MLNLNSYSCRSEAFRQALASVNSHGKQGRNALNVINQFMSGEIPNATLFKIAYQQALTEDAKEA